MTVTRPATDNRANTAHTRPPGFDPSRCHLCTRPLHDHQVNEFCRAPDPTRPATPSVPASKEFQIMSKTATWVDQAANDLGIKPEPVQCRHCKGKGSRSSRIGKGEISRAIFGYTTTAAQMAKTFSNPDLSRLQAVAEALGGVSLDGAAAWCAALAKRIEAEG